MGDLSSLATIALGMMGATALLSADVRADALLNKRTAPIAVPTMGAEPLRAISGPDGRLYLDAEVNGHSTRFVVDTGASHTVLRPQDALRAGISSSDEANLRVVGAKVVARSGVAERMVVDGHALAGVEVFVVDDLPVSLLGLNVLRKLPGVYLKL